MENIIFYTDNRYKNIKLFENIQGVKLFLLLKILKIQTLITLLMKILSKN